MELVYADLELINPFDLENVKRNLLDKEEVRRINVKIQVGGASSLVINEVIQSKLNLDFREKKKFKLSDRNTVEYDVVGPVEVKFSDRRTCCDAVVLPGASEPLLGSIPMLGLDVIIDPHRQELILNPHSLLVRFYTNRLLKLAMRSGTRI